jgi:DNA-binding MarR family transcriptional regulator
MNKSNNLKLDRQLCFALYATTNAVTRSYRKALNKADLTYTQYLVMLTLWEEDLLCVGKIAEKLELKSSTLTPVLKKMETRGFIKQQRNVYDHRIVEVSLTDEGRNSKVRIGKIQKNIQTKIGLDEKEYIQLKTSLQMLFNKLNA